MPESPCAPDPKEGDKEGDLARSGSLVRSLWSRPNNHDPERGRGACGRARWPARLTSVGAGFRVRIETPGGSSKGSGMAVEIGDEAPDFELPDQHGTPVKLSSFR